MLVATPTVLTPFAAALLLASGVVAYAHNRPGGSESAFGDTEHRALELEDPERDAWQMPEAVIRALGLAPNAVVADVGSATGYFAARLAHAVPHGRVIGIDVDPAMVGYLNRRARRERLVNLSARLATPDDPRLAPQRADFALVVDTYPYIAHREHYFGKLRGALRPGGRLAVIDFRADAPFGPPAYQRVPPRLALAELARAGFALQRQYHFLPHQHFLLLRAAPRRRA